MDTIITKVFENECKSCVSFNPEKTEQLETPFISTYIIYIYRVSHNRYLVGEFWKLKETKRMRLS